MLEKNDWRLMGQDKFLMDKTLKFATWHAPKPTWDHDHCAFCTEKFSEREGDFHTGYCTLNERWWICPECYEDFQELFHWSLQKKEGSPL